MNKQYYVYILTNEYKNVLYTGFTSNLLVRVWQHKNKYFPHSFSARYRTKLLVYYEIYENAYEAISREKQIKAGSRKKKLDLINKMNPDWRDLCDTL